MIFEREARNMIQFIAKHFIKAEHLAEFIDVMKVLVEETNKNDFGCIRYELYQDQSDPTVLVNLEQWESQEAIDAHLKAKHFLDAVSKIKHVYAKGSEFNSCAKLF